MHSLFNPNRPEKVRLGTSLTTQVVAAILSPFHEFTNVFAWSHADMPRVLPELVEHRLSVQDSCRPIQKRLIEAVPFSKERGDKAGGG